MIDRLYYWLKNKKRVQPAPMVSQTVETKEVEIPVGGITDSGVIYEKEVRPQGNVPIYTEVRMSEDNGIQTEEKDTKGNK